MSETTRTSSAALSVRYTVLPERMPPIAPENYNDLQKKVAAELSSSRGSVRGPFGAMLRSPELADCMQKVGQYVRFKCGLDKRLNRLAGMLATRHWCNQYEWNGHVPYALKAGMAQTAISGARRRSRRTSSGARQASLRSAEVERAETIVNEEVNKFMAWRRSRGAVPTIVALRQRFDAIRRSELVRLEGKSPRHQEYVKIPTATRPLQNFVAYPEVATKSTVVIVIHENMGLSDWARAFADELRRQPLAIEPEAANRQHYEVPARFFVEFLGPRLKYSSCLWPADVTELAAAEEAMLGLTCERAGLADGTMHWFFGRQAITGQGMHVPAVTSGAADILRLENDEIVARALEDAPELADVIVPHRHGKKHHSRWRQYIGLTLTMPTD